jgi:TPP-dependent pyruvate/acetoin dehydrogenase alpha subunit
MSRLYNEMLRLRLIEEAIAKRYKEQKMRCPVHLSVGQEAGPVGVCSALSKDDKVVGTHRGHNWYLAKGGSLKGLIGELYGKASGCSKGNGGSMHLIDRSCGFLGSTSIVGGTVPIGVGIAFSEKLKEQKNTTVISIGDAAIEEGVFHESANFASLHRLNVIFACENNRYSCFTHIRERQPGRPLDVLAHAHCLFYQKCEPNDVEDIRKKTLNAIAYGGPCFIEIPTHRRLQHCGPDLDDDLGYRTVEEIRFWQDLDPLLINKYDMDSVGDAAIGKIMLEIEAAFEDAERADFPGLLEVGKYVYAPIDIQRSY